MRSTGECEIDRRAVVMAGVGLVGGAVCDALRRRAGWRLLQTRVHWADAGGFAERLRSTTAGLAAAPPLRLDWIWSAGRAELASGRLETEAEERSFRFFVDAVARSRDRCTPAALRLHVISSAGGLYEGCRGVDARTPLCPRRPYGLLKLQQERIARERFGPKGLHVYRPSSVYGFIRPGRRVGLVSALVSNALCQRTTICNGRFETLRDYVWAGDIGEFVADRVMSSDVDTSSVSVLASGKPTSIFEMRSLVQRITGRSVYVRLVADDANTEHITFLPSVLPNGWSVSSLSTNIRRVVADALSTGSVMARPRWASDADVEPALAAQRENVRP